MSTLTLKSVPEELHERLKKRAERHRRGMNSEAIMILERALKPSRMSAGEAIARAEKLKSRAHANRRSIDMEVPVVLERALGERATPEDDLLRRAERLRERTPTRLTEEKRQEAIRRDRA
jgi:plasmid stability protein